MNIYSYLLLAIAFGGLITTLVAIEYFIPVGKPKRPRR